MPTVQGRKFFAQLADLSKTFKRACKLPRGVLMSALSRAVRLAWLKSYTQFTSSSRLAMNNVLGFANSAEHSLRWSPTKKDNQAFMQAAYMQIFKGSNKNFKGIPIDKYRKLSTRPWYTRPRYEYIPSLRIPDLFRNPRRCICIKNHTRTGVAIYTHVQNWCTIYFTFTI